MCNEGNGSNLRLKPKVRAARRAQGNFYLLMPQNFALKQFHWLMLHNMYFESNSVALIVKLKLMEVVFTLLTDLIPLNTLR